MQQHYTKPAIQQAFQRFKTLSADERLRLLAEMRERALRLSLNAALEEGREEGMLKGELSGKIQRLQNIMVLRVVQLEGVQHPGVQHRRCNAAEQRYCPAAPGCKDLFALLTEQRRRGVLSGILSVSKGLSKGCTPWPVLAAFVYGLSWTIKPLTILTAPFILPQLGMAGFLSLAMWGGYVCWSLQWVFGRQQFSFLLQQLLIRSMKSSGKGTGAPQASLTLAARWWKRLNTIRNALTWRWEHLGSKAVTALPFYLFPAYLRPWMWQGVVLAAIIVLGYGNIKYLLLDLLFVFPVRREEGLL